MKQREVAATIGVHRKRIGIYERGRNSLKAATFQRAVAATGHGPCEAELALLTVTALAPATASNDRVAVHVHAYGPLPGERRLPREGAARLMVDFANLAEPCLRADIATRLVAAARSEAAQLWQRLASVTADERLMLVETLQEFQGWAVAERLASVPWSCPVLVDAS